MNFVYIESRIRKYWYFSAHNETTFDENSNSLNLRWRYKKIVTKEMFNTSKHSSERSMRHEPSQRGSSAQRSKSARSTPNSSRHSDSRPQCKMPIWVHCEKCFVNYEMNPNMMLLSCGNIFCVTCLRVDDGNAWTVTQTKR